MWDVKTGKLLKQLSGHSDDVNNVVFSPDGKSLASSSVEAADIAAKKGGVSIVEIRLAIGFGGKSYVKMIGSLDEVEAAMESGMKGLRYDCGKKVVQGITSIDEMMRIIITENGA